MRLRSALAALTLAASVLASSSLAADAPVSFSKDIQPILQNNCLKCHGAAVQLAKLDLRTRESAMKGGEHGAVIVPGKPEESKLYRMVSGHEKPTMPMDGKLSAEQIAAIQRWIAAGAPFEGEIKASAEDAAAQLAKLEETEIPPEARKYWAFQKPLRHPVPPLAPHPVDAFLLETLKDKGLKPAPAADKRTLLRRAYMDLAGLPPTPVEVDEFLEDKSPYAWENLIERLLASPAYGERWGRHWLDVARYADSNGFEHDFTRPNAWRYRDYVIRSFNRDTPFNLFIQEQIAGDELDWVTHDTLIATAFLRNYAKVGFREKDNPQFRFEYLDDMIATIGRGLLGLTVQCARCHNHKFDPIPQKDYYRMQAALFGYVEVDHPLTSPEAAEAHDRKIEEIEAQLKPLREKISELDQPYRERLQQDKFKKWPAHIQEAIFTPEEKRTPGQVLLANQIIRTTAVSADEIERAMTLPDLEMRRDLNQEIKRIEAERPKPLPVAMGITDGDYRFAPDGPGDEPAPGKGVKREAVEGSFLFRGPGRYEPPPSYFLHSGDIESRGSLMEPGFVTAASVESLPVERPPSHGRTSGRRRALAAWITHPDNPLTARVFVNRIWHHHFGGGIVSTLDNFGKMGDTPSHPELLDWLAVEFMNRGWSVKQMHRLLMTSQAYKMSSQFADAESLRKDPDNHYLWRYRIQRLEAEIVRDAILAVSGGLNREFGGPSVFPELQPEILASMKHGIWEREEDGPKVWRRSVYVYRKRGLPYPFFEVFDLPDQNTSCGGRNVSTVPTQALTLMNNEFVLKQAGLFADRVKETAGDDRDKQIETAYGIALSRPPSAEERQAAQVFLNENSLTGLTHVLLNLNEFLYLR
ncbi:MAG: PSD1 and planctomycete cytochrome C domain-containing protein [Bryobacteraceae bacterium]